MIARRGWTSRLAALAVAPDFRGRGLGKSMMRVALEEAVLRKDRATILEVFEQNPAAVSLYSGLGFHLTRRLVGYDFHPQGTRKGGSDVEHLQEIDPLIVARLMAKEGESDLPWRLTPETLGAATQPAQAFHLNETAFTIVGEPSGRNSPLPLIWSKWRATPKTAGAQICEDRCVERISNPAFAGCNSDGGKYSITPLLQHSAGPDSRTRTRTKAARENARKRSWKR